VSLFLIQNIKTGIFFHLVIASGPMISILVQYNKCKPVIIRMRIDHLHKKRKPLFPLPWTYLDICLPSKPFCYSIYTLLQSTQLASSSFLSHSEKFLGIGLCKNSPRVFFHLRSERAGGTARQKAVSAHVSFRTSSLLHSCMHHVRSFATAFLPQFHLNHASACTL
jgi:hypothetical protein